MKRRQAKKREKYRSRRLIAQFPWLQEKVHWYSGRTTPKRERSFGSTWLDDMPCGWRRAWGVQMCRDIDEELRKFNYRDEFVIVQVKEKFGQLRLYHNGVPHGSNVGDITSIYSHISEHTCAYCGRFGVPLTDAGWVLPICRECFKKIRTNMAYEDSIIEEEYDPIIRIKSCKRGEDGEYHYETREIDTMPYVTKMKRRFSKFYLEEIGYEV